jgi:AcrR family transcriptional regulator
VIATLRDEGVVDARPGAGTVVRSPHAEPVVRKMPREQELSQDRIVRAAVAIADAEGLSGVSMRRLATDLGVATMSLYRHVSSKEDLMLYMADAAVGEEPFPARPVRWRASLEIVARLLWTVCRRHPWVAEVLSMTRPRATPHLLMYSEWALSVLRELGLSMQDMMYIHLNLFSHVRGLALSMAAESQARQDTGITNDEWMDSYAAEFQRITASGNYPTMEYVITLEFEQDLDTMFEYGLRLLLDGIECRLG